MTSAAKPEKTKSRPKRKWLKRCVWILSALLLVLVIFHQPILMALIRFGVNRFAASQHLNIQYEVEGRALSGLTFKNVRIVPNGRSPVEKMSIESVQAEYSLMGLLKHGRLHFLTNLHIKNATLVFKDLHDEESRKPKPSSLGTDLHLWLFPPVNYAGSMTVENLNIVTHMQDGDDFTLQSGNVYFDRGGQGALKIDQMKIPNLKLWKGIEGRLTVTEKDLTVSDLRISPEITAGKVVSSPAAGDGRIATLSLQADIFGGHVSAEYASTKRDGKVDAKLSASATKFGFDGLRRFLDADAPISGEFDRVDVSCAGDPGIPSSWSGSSSASVTAPARVGEFKIDLGDTKLVLENGAIKIASSLSCNGVDKLTSDAQGQMPGRLKEFPGMTLDGRFRITAPDLSLSINGFTHGEFMGEGHFNLQNRTFGIEIIATGKEINTERFDVSQIDLKAEITRSLPGPQQQARSISLDDANGRMTARFKDARVDKYAFDSGGITAEVKNGWLRVDGTDIKRESNSMTFNGSCHVPRDFAKFRSADFDLNFSLSAPNAAAFNAEPNLKGINGQLEATGAISHHNDFYDGKIDINGTKLASVDFDAESVSAAITIEKSVVNLRNFLLVVDAKNRVTGDGTVDLHKPFAYAGRIQAGITDLAVFNHLLDTAGIKQKIGGALSLEWSGSGVVSEIHHTGEAKIKVTGGKYGNFQPITAEIAGNYSPDVVEIPTLHVHVDKTDFVARVDLHDTVLQVHDILLQQEKIRLLQGELVLPVDLRTPANPDSLIPPDGRIFANLTSDEINLDTLLLQPKQTSPLRGMMRLSINADGPLDDLPANILLRIRNLQAKSTPAVAPGNLELNADLKDNRLTLHGGFQQPAISPLQIDGNLPFPLKQIIKKGKIDENSPVELSVKLEKSPVTIINQLIPRIRYIEGQMGIDARARGTIARPELSGAVLLDLPAIRLNDPAAPAVNGFKGSLEFTGNQLLVHQFGGEISGGPFNLTGRIVFEKLTSPTLDLRLISQNALILRNETLTVRADSDLKIAGIFNAAHVSGNVGLTKSKFFREVEILPIELPGRPAPKPPAEMQTGFSLKPPLSNWTFDIAIKSKDPFLVRGNMGNGGAHIDVKLVGTGYSPTLDGLVRIDNFTASLPFSRLNIEYGYLYFSTDNPFEPTLDIQGSSSLRDYNIHVYISGTPSEPVSVFTSDPPLPQEEIIALLGTGATTGELTGNSDVLAGRAAVLLVQKFYRKIFKRKPQETQSFLTRFELDPGTIDPRTGKQEVSARFKASDQVSIIGDIDEQGGLRGQVRYLLRFR